MKWWPFQAILANVATFVFLRRWLHQEGLTYRSLFRIEKGQLKRYILQFLLLIVVGFALGGIPLYAASYLILGSVMPPDTMFQALPVWAAVVAPVAFPVSNALAETPTYISATRYRACRRRSLRAVVPVGLALAFQHVALPLVGDVPYMLWRFASFILLAIALGFITTVPASCCR